MRQSTDQETWLREFHWNALANIHVELCFLRHQFIKTINARVANQNLTSIEALDQLASVDELLQDASRSLEEAKKTLFSLSYDPDLTKPNLP